MRLRHAILGCVLATGVLVSGSALRAATLEVARENPAAADTNPGTRAAPLLTISAAAARAVPGDTILVRSGVYRERVAPARGGESFPRRITYLAAAGEPVAIRGSTIWRPAFTPAPTAGIPALLRAPLDLALFAEENFNPFVSAATHGQLFADGVPLREVLTPFALAAPGTWLAVEGGAALLVHPPVAPEKIALWEISVRRHVFAPRARGLGYLTVRGFIFEHTAGAETAAFDTGGGHHWWIEGNTLRLGCGIALDGSGGGHHVIDRNVLSDYGGPALVVADSPGTLVVGNHLSRASRLVSGTAALVVRDLRAGAITDNVIVENFAAGVSLEGDLAGATVARNVVAHNAAAGLLVSSTAGYALVAHNLVIANRYYGIDLNADMPSDLAFVQNTLAANAAAFRGPLRAARDVGNLVLPLLGVTATLDLAAGTATLALTPTALAALPTVSAPVLAALPFAPLTDFTGAPLADYAPAGPLASLVAGENKFRLPDPGLGAPRQGNTFKPASATRPDRVIVYKRVGDRELRLHAFIPPAGSVRAPTPAIVYFFGGGWGGGEPDQFFWQARYLADRGVAGFCAEYRLISARAGLTPVDCTADAKSALRYVRAHAAELGLDPHRLAAAGNSAGAQLAYATGLCATGDDPADPSPAISSRADALLLFDTPVDLLAREDIVVRFPSRESTRALSATQNLRADAPPMLLLHGTADAGLPAVGVEHFVRAARTVGVDATLRLWPLGYHGFYHYARDRTADAHTAFLVTTLTVDRWLAARGWLAGPPDEPALLRLAGPPPTLQ